MLKRKRCFQSSCVNDDHDQISFSIHCKHHARHRLHQQHHGRHHELWSSCQQKQVIAICRFPGGALECYFDCCRLPELPAPKGSLADCPPRDRVLSFMLHAEQTAHLEPLFADGCFLPRWDTEKGAAPKSM